MNFAITVTDNSRIDCMLKDPWKELLSALGDMQKTWQIMVLEAQGN